MDKSLMPAFRLVGAQIRTVKAEMSKSRPEGSPKLTKEQVFFRKEAHLWFDKATAEYLFVEQDLSHDSNRRGLSDASWWASLAQSEWRKAHPSEAPAIQVVKLPVRPVIHHIDGDVHNNAPENLRVVRL